MARKREAKSNQVYQLKITLVDIKPAIWRRFQVSADITLELLHEHIQAVMGWENYHLHQFTIGDDDYGVPHPDYDYMGGEMLDEKKYKLCRLVNEGDVFGYEYDFGDGWRHKIKVEKVLAAEPGVKYPRCIAGKRSCPPEDCGGAWGYEKMLEILKDPKHEQYEEYSDWIGEDFDPEEFDLTNTWRNLSV